MPGLRALGHGKLRQFLLDLQVHAAQEVVAEGDTLVVGTHLQHHALARAQLFLGGYGSRTRMGCTTRLWVAVAGFTAAIQALWLRLGLSIPQS